MLEAGQWRSGWRLEKGANRAERNEARMRLGAARRDPELVEQLHIRPRDHLGKDFGPDKLGAAERWLLAQVGRPWAKVEGEIRSRFDTRSLAGRHLVFDHLLPGCHRRPDSGWTVNGRFVFFVDRHGFLRARQRVSTKRPAKVRRETVDWLADRKIGIYRSSDRLTAYWLELVGTAPWLREWQPRYRQAARLDPSELERFAQLNSAERDAYVIDRSSN